MVDVAKALDQHYEEKFEFPLWKLIKQRAEEKDISYVKAAEEVVPEYVKTIPYRNFAYDDALIKSRLDEMIQFMKTEEQERAAKQKARGG